MTRIAVLFLSAGPLLFADVTLRYNSDFKMALPMPAGQTPQASPLPTVRRIKGDKAYTTLGKLTMIEDLATKRATFLDPEHMRYASGSSVDFVNAMTAAVSNQTANIPPQAQSAMQMFKADVQARKTGRTETIQGLPAEESEIVLSMNMNFPLPNVPVGTPAMRMVMHVWRASADVVAKTPGLAELARYSVAAGAFADPDASASLRRMMAVLPSFGDFLDGFQRAVEDLNKQPGIQLRMRMEEFSPMLAGLQGQGQTPAGGLNPSAPVLSMTNELVELSTAPIDDSVFQIPAGYREVGLDDIAKDWLATVGGRKSQ